MHSSIEIANKLIEIAKKNKKTLTPMQLIKLVFLCHGWMLGLYRRHLINDSIEAWKYGPVIPNLYQKIKQFRSNPVTTISYNNKYDFDEDELDIINQVYNIYGNYNGIQLSVLTHEKDSPWDITWKNGNQIISNDLIENYYQNQINDKKTNTLS